MLMVFCTTSAPAQTAGTGHGTAVVVLRSPKAIYAAVDSKLTMETSLDGVRTTYSAAECKVKRVGPYYSIVAGLARTSNGFDALEEVAHDYKAGDDLTTLANAVLQSVPRSLGPMLQQLYDTAPDVLSAHLSDSALNLTIVGSDHGVTKVIVDEFSVTQNRATISVTGKAVSCPGDCPTANAGYFLGAHEATESAVRQNPSILTHADEQVVGRLIHLEYESRPDVVGGPVSIVKVTPSGASVLRAGACTDDMSGTSVSAESGKELVGGSTTANVTETAPDAARITITALTAEAETTLAGHTVETRTIFSHENTVKQALDPEQSRSVARPSASRNAIMVLKVASMFGFSGLPAQGALAAEGVRKKNIAASSGYVVEVLPARSASVVVSGVASFRIERDGSDDATPVLLRLDNSAADPQRIVKASHFRCEHAEADCGAAGTVLGVEMVTVPFSVDGEDDEVTVTPSQPLAPGEYAIVLEPASSEGGQTKQPIVAWDFKVL